MPFDYSKSNLPANVKWERALHMCHWWLSQNMSQFGPNGIENFMMHQPIAAAKLLLDNCPDCSEELVTVVLAGPAKGNIIANCNSIISFAQVFSERTVDLMLCLAGVSAPDAEMDRDMVRLFLVEGLSSMNDQLIGRAKLDKHHQVRWNMLRHFEQSFAQVKGQNPALDVIFEEALVKSRAALEALDVKTAPKAPKPPGM